MKIEDAINKRNFINAQHKAHLNIMFTSNWLIGISKEVLKPFGITHQQFSVLKVLEGRHPGYCSADSIKEVMLDKSPDLTRLMDRLIGKGFVTRGVCEENRRKLDIGITDNGMALIKDIDPKMSKRHLQKKFITDKEATELSRILDKMRD